MRILVTGGAGFLGSHLCKTLLDQGHEVICLDNLYTGSKKNIAPFLENSRFEFIEHDIVEPISLKGIDQIYNLACPASPPAYQANPVKTWKDSTLGVLNMLELARQNGARFFQASTSEVYGDPLKHPQKESYWGNVNPIGTRSCYDEGKRAAEALIMDYHRMYGTAVRIVRIFNTYGPCMNPRDGRVVSNFIVQALVGTPITIYGDGTQTRSFCYVDDLIRGFVLLMNGDHIGPVNMGNPGEFTMRELAELVIARTGSASTIEYQPLPQDDPKQRRPDITRAKELLGWEPTVSLQEGLIKTIAYFKGILHEQDAFVVKQYEQGALQK